jgi:hypothetical protein
MILVLAMAGALWGIGALMKVPSSVRFAMLALLWAALVGLHVALPDGHPLRLATGGAAQGWVALGILAALVLAYRAGLRRLRAKVAPAAAQAPSGAFRPAELDRYARHIMLREIGGPGQRKLKDSKVLVPGGLARLRCCIWRGPGWGFWALSMMTWSMGPTCSARSSMPISGSGCPRCFPPKSPCAR